MFAKCGFIFTSILHKSFFLHRFRHNKINYNEKMDFEIIKLFFFIKDHYAHHLFIFFFSVYFQVFLFRLLEFINAVDNLFFFLFCAVTKSIRVEAEQIDPTPREQVKVFDQKISVLIGTKELSAAVWLPAIHICYLFFLWKTQIYVSYTKKTSFYHFNIFFIILFIYYYLF